MAPVTRYCRKKNEETVYVLTDALMERGDMFECDLKGKFKPQVQGEVPRGDQGSPASDAPAAEPEKAKGRKAKG